MGLWDFVKNIGSKILGMANSARDTVSKIYSGIKKIPVIGNIADGLASMNIPGVGMSAKDIANKASDYLDTANSLVGRGRLNSPD